MLKHIIILCVFSFSLYSQNIQVETTFGKVEGKKDGSINTFLGIPFAKPPVGNLRWKPPEDPLKWDTVLITKNFRSKCVQKSYSQIDADTSIKVEGSEDCLYLNIWSPSLSDSLPVLFFIHGGGNQQGSASEKAFGTYLYDGKLFAERGNAVIVTTNYRIGALGFLVHKGLEDGNKTSGNYGLLDQIQALKWVKNNIARFGGNPQKLMIFGESAGAVNTGILIISSLAKGLFSRALMESGSPVAVPYITRLEQGVEFAKKMGSTTNDPNEQINYLRHLAPEKLVEFSESPLKGGIAQMAWGPTIDGWAISDDPKQLLDKGNFNRMPVIIGSNADEVALTAPQTITPVTYNLFLKSTIPQKYEQEALALYPPGITNQSARDAYIQLLTDAQFTTLARRTARSIVKNQNEPVYKYFFSHKLASVLASYGSFHGLELFYIFQTLENSSYNIFGMLPKDDRDVMKYMLNYWRNFAESGNPNSASLPEWKKYDAASDPYLNINPYPINEYNLRKEKCDFWDKIMNVTTSVDENIIPEKFYLYQNYPNPFNPSTVIRYRLAVPGIVRLKVYDILGRETSTLVNEYKQSGIYDYTFSIRNLKLPSGVYYYRLETGLGIYSKKMILLK